jgi:thioesterase domain-containing protein
MELEKIEPFNSLGFRAVEVGDRRVVISVPLDGNRNDKGTMFGGSVYSAMVLAGWKLCVEQAKTGGFSGDIVIRDSSISFLRPMTSNLLAEAVATGEPRETPRGNIAFDVEVSAANDTGKTCARFSGSYRLIGQRSSG